LKNFWPPRPIAKGFTIQNFARKYGLRFSSVSSAKNSNQRLSDDTDSCSILEDINNRLIVNQSIKKTHWANRDFSEYKEVA
tara:strand:+ start:800 stop:1042 length:243 start_codon:yes stop_codon:yes gene_type:complete